MLTRKRLGTMSLALTLVVVGGMALGLRSGRDARAEVPRHVAEYIGEVGPGEFSEAHARFMRSQPLHWRACMLKKR